MLRIAAPEASPLSERRVRAGPHPPSECSRNVFCPFPVLWMLACQFPSLFPRTNSRNHSSSAHSRSRHHTESFTPLLSESPSSLIISTNTTFPCQKPKLSPSPAALSSPQLYPQPRYLEPSPVWIQFQSNRPTRNKTKSPKPHINDLPMRP